MAELRTISLRESLGAVSFVATGDVRAARFTTDSRQVRRGDVFVAIRGASSDGHQYLRQAVDAGACAVVVEEPRSDLPVPQCVTCDTRVAWSQLSLALFAQPQQDLTIAAITGTNGKTTSTWMLRSILQAAGRVTGLIGTIEYSDGLNRQAARLTTPDAMEIASQLHRMRLQGATHCVMELSSHALDQRRCAAVTLAAAAITNLTHDHLDYHGDLDNYLAAKARIADLLAPGRPLLSGLEPELHARLLERLPRGCSAMRFGCLPSDALRMEIVSTTSSAQVVALHLAGGRVEVRSELLGRHNALNLLTAAALAEQLDVPLDHIVTGLERLDVVPGRMERIQAGQSFTTIVDYAHTPDGLRQLVETCRGMTRGRVLLVFGAGGDRDRLKRPLMGAAASKADLVFVTSDNPRSECPDRIIEDLCHGLAAGCCHRAIRDREAAIREAIQSAEPGDVLVIAGRGHETTQVVGDRCIGFDDRRVTRRILLEHFGTASTVAQAGSKCG